MKFVLFLSLIFSSVCSFAQSVIKVQGTEATVHLSADEVMKVGDRVHFLNSKLDTAGEGEITKISSGGKKALVKVVAGKVQAGMTFEKKAAKEAVTTADDSESSMEVSKSDGISYASLSERDREILARGEISKGRYIVGGILGTYPLGFGIGHAIQGRYTEKGWIFTVGEAGSLAVLIAGMGSCMSSWHSDNCNGNGGLIWIGAFSFIGFRIWEIVDVWAAPPELNRRYRELKSRLPASEGEITFEPGFMPLADGDVLGLRMTF
ncbi:hypothetical protein [Bdellovibrio bacteriovorus]|uniref:hypothetical protein n=1 Tax=Bdellovibrio bacteriovorus TaxID=959 RepID=UPI0035A5BF1A